MSTVPKHRKKQGPTKEKIALATVFLQSDCKQIFAWVKGLKYSIFVSAWF
jgi:hypothetical protein